jgi:hemoglobin
MKSNYLKSILAVIIMQSLIGCALLASTEEHDLYENIGGQIGIETIVDTFIKKIPGDKDILPYFAKSSVSHFRKGFITHLCDSIGGPCDYKGDSMSDIHTGMNINEKDFNRIVELLISAMEESGISFQNQNRILKTLTPSRSDIINL